MVGIDSTIAKVMVYAEGARVIRVAQVPAPAAEGEVRLVGLPLTLDDASLRISATGAVASGVRIALAATGVEAPEPVDQAALSAATEAASAADAALVRIDRALAELDLLVPPPRAEPKEGPRPAWDAALTARLALVELRGARERALRAERAEAVRIADEAQRALAIAAGRAQRATSARTPRAHELRKAAIVGLRAITGPVELTLEYLVPGARWAPTYVARLGGGQLSLELRAVVAQRTGEDWAGVALALSTAAAQRFTELPDLAAAKIGRRQAPPPRPGWRPPPIGAGALYADWDRAFGSRQRTEAAPPEPKPAESFDEDEIVLGGRQERPVPPPPPGAMADMKYAPTASYGAPPMQAMKTMAAMPAPMAPQAMPMPASRSAAKGGGVMRAMGAALGGAAMAVGGVMRKSDEGGGGMMEEEAAEPEELAASAELLAFGELCLPPATSRERGKLVRVGRRVRYRQLLAVTELDVLTIVDDATRAARRLAAPPEATATGWDTAFDFAFEADGTVDVPSDGEWHGLALTTASAPSQLRHVVVPREVTDVFRIAELTSPFDAPLLPGPMDVYDGRDFVLTTPVAWVAPRGAITLGLGVDPRVKVTRNVDYREESAGMLRGSLRLAHEVQLTAENLGPRPIDLEVRERVPVGIDGDDDVAVTVEAVDPPWEPWHPDPGAAHAARLRGGHRWRLTLAPGERRALSATYAIKIASKHELVGGNRREP